MNLKTDYLVSYFRANPTFLQGLIPSNALRAHKNDEDESCQIALSNLRSEVIKMRNEAVEKDKILLSLVDKVKKDEAKFNAHFEAHKAKVEDLRKNLPKLMKILNLQKRSKKLVNGRTLG
jgi:molybdopterin converting factor small subunit